MDAFPVTATLSSPPWLRPPYPSYMSTLSTHYASLASNNIISISFLSRQVWHRG
jgi:hypothetical protein